MCSPATENSLVLIVEDDQIIALDLETRIERMGLTVCACASTGADAVAQAAEHRPQLVIMDYRLKGAMNGLQAAERICADHPTFILFLTGHASSIPSTSLHALKASLLSKPFRDVDLERVIRVALNL